MPDIHKEIIESEIRATGAKQVQDDILKVNQAFKELTQEQKNLSMIKNKLESDGKKHTKEYENNTAAIEANKKAIANNREEITKLNGQMKLSDMTYNQLSKRAAELRNHLNNISKSADPAKWNQYNQQLKETTNQMSMVRSGTQQTSSVMGVLTKGAGFLAAGFFSVSTAIKAGKAIMEATQFTADAFEKSIAGAKQAVDYFFISISSGDWENFWEGLRKSSESAEDLAGTMDTLGDVRRGLSIQEVRNENEKNDLLTQLRDKTGKVTVAEKEKLYARLLEIDTNYNSKVLEGTFRERDGILKLYSDITGLREDKIFEIISKYSDYEERFNNAATKLEKAKVDFFNANGGLSSSAKFNQDEYIESLNDVDKMYIKLYLNYGKLNDSKLDKLKDSIIAVEKAMGAGTRTQLEYIRLYNEIFKAQKEVNNDLTPEQLLSQANQSVLDDAIKEGDKFAEESQKQINKYADEAFKAVNDKADEATKAEMKSFLTAAEYDINVYQQTADGKKAILEKQLHDGEISQQEYQDKITEIDSQASKARLDIAQKLFGSVSKLFRKNTIAYKVLASAEATIDAYKAANAAYASMAKIPYVGPALGAAAAAAAIIAGLANVAEINQVQLWTGGYTGDGGKYEPSDKVQYHKGEYVVAQDEYAVPEVRSFVDSVIEPMRMRRLNYSPYAYSTTTPGRAEGGYSGSNRHVSGSDPELKAMIATNNKLMAHLINEGVNANFDETKIHEMRQRVARQESMDARAKS